MKSMATKNEDLFKKKLKESFYKGVKVIGATTTVLAVSAMVGIGGSYTLFTSDDQAVQDKLVVNNWMSSNVEKITGYFNTRDVQEIEVPRDINDITITYINTNTSGANLALKKD